MEPIYLNCMMEYRFFIGTSGWSYKHWKSLFYPPEIKAKDYLAYYSETFNTTEINSSFYLLPKDYTVNNWISSVPAHFKFCPKISRYISHLKKLNDPEEPLERFFNIFDPIADHLGPVLIQLPKMVRFEQKKTSNFYSLLSSKYADYKFVLEPRDITWFTDISLDLMFVHNIGLVISHSNGIFPYKEAVTAKHIYLRFHGPEQLYGSQYSKAQLINYADKCVNWINDGHVVWAFFNNDIGGFATGDALRFRKLLELKLNN